MPELNDANEQDKVDDESDDRPGAEFAALLRDHLERDPRHPSYQDLAELTGLSRGYIVLLCRAGESPNRP